MTLAIETRDLSKRYGRRVALRGLDLGVAEGALVGFLGPNGAGKTTLIRILMGMIRSTSGQARLLGRDCWADGRSIRAEVGYLPGESRLYERLTGRATLRFLAGVRRVDCLGEAERLAGVFGLDLGCRVRAGSRGMKQKLGLIGAMMHRPRLLVLDEPTSGLDPIARRALFDELRAAAAEGRTVLFSSHTVAEVDALCDEVAVLRDGRLVEFERVDALRDRAPRRVEIALAPDADSAPPAWPDGFRPERGPVPGRFAGRWTGPVRPLLDWLGAERSVRDARIVPLDLEELFLDYYQADSGPPDDRRPPA